MMRMLRLELKKTNIRPYCIASAVIFLCSLGLSYIFAYVPTLDSGSQNSAILFSTYQGIMSINGAIILMACSALASAMGYRYVIREYCGSQAILLFSYPVRQKRILWAKTMLLLAFTSMTVIFTALGGFVIFALTANMLPCVVWPDSVFCLRSAGELCGQSLVLIHPVHAINDLWRRA